MIHEYILDGSDAGTLEQRTRYYFLAVSAGLAQFFDFESIEKHPRIHNTLSDILEDVDPDSKLWADNDYLKAKAVRDAEAGKGFAKRQLKTPECSEVGVIGKFYAKKRSTEPFLIRDEDDKERIFTANEHSDIKRIPKELIAGVPSTVAHEGLGQSGLFTHFTSLAQVLANGILNMRNQLGTFAAA